MNSPKFNDCQMEFGFAETAIGKGRRKGRVRKSSAQLRSEKLAKTEEETLKSPASASAVDTNEPVRRIDWAEASGALGSDWIEGVCCNIMSTCNLREAVSLTACYLTDLIDREIDVRGHNGAWKEEYEAYCWTHYFRLAIETETESKELRALWWMAGIVLNMDSGASDRSDWELFEDMCEVEPDFVTSDENGEDVSFIEFLATFLSNFHQHLLRANGRTFSERHPDSNP